MDSHGTWRERSRSTAAYAVRLLVLAAIYYAAARLGLRYASIGESVSLIWPPTGIAFAGDGDSRRSAD